MKKMKSFRLYVPDPPATPTRVISDFTEEEKTAFAETFKPSAAGYRRKKRIAGALICGSFALLLLTSLVFRETNTLALWVGAIIGVLCALVVTPRFPMCPGCENSLDTSSGPYCPACGSRSQVLERGQRVTPCLPIEHRTRRVGRRKRRYRISYCTHCGLHLDKDGL